MSIYEKSLEIKGLLDILKMNLGLSLDTPLSDVVNTASSGGGGGKYAPRYVAQPITFQNYIGTELDYETTMLDTTNFTSMASMFESCGNLIRLDVSGWNTSNVTNMNSMFYRLLKLVSLDLKNFDTSNVDNMSYMFAYSSGFTSLDLSSFDTSRVTTMSNMFRGCSNLNHLDIRNFTFDSVTNHSSMFSNVPTNCLIIVKSETEKQWVLTNGNANFTNVKTVYEYENPGSYEGGSAGSGNSGGND